MGLSADGADRIERTLGDEDGFAVLNEDTEALANEIVGDFGEDGRVFGETIGGGSSEGPIDWVSIAGLKQGVDLGEAQDLGRLFAIEVVGTVDANLAEGEGAGFVGAEDVHAPDAFDGGEALDDDLALGHFDGAAGKIDADDSREELGCESDREGKGKKEGVEDGPPKEGIDGKDSEGKEDGEVDQKEPESADAAFEIGLRAGVGQAFGNAADFGLRSDLDSEKPSGSAGDVATREEDILPLGDSVVGFGGAGHLLDREGLAGEGGFIGEEVRRGDEKSVGGDDASGIDEDDVAGDHGSAGNFDRLTVLEDFDLGLD